MVATRAFMVDHTHRCFPSRASHASNAAAMLGQRLRRWPSIATALDCGPVIMWFSGEMHLRTCRIHVRMRSVPPPPPPPQQTQDINPMLVEYWSTVCDAGPALTQHRVNVWCLWFLRSPPHIERTRTLGLSEMYIIPIYVLPGTFLWLDSFNAWTTC